MTPNYELKSYDNLNSVDEAVEEAKNAQQLFQATNIKPELELASSQQQEESVSEKVESASKVKELSKIDEDTPKLKCERKLSAVQELKAKFEQQQQQTLIKKPMIKLTDEDPSPKTRTDTPIVQNISKASPQPLPQLKTESNIPKIDIPTLNIDESPPPLANPDHFKQSSRESSPQSSTRSSTKLEPIHENSCLETGRKSRHGRKPKSLYKQQLAQEFIHEYGYSSPSISARNSNVSNTSK
ncbi:UNVERIFIED_CONTAM: hypothetical protein HDU68_005716 [Siphonaria sp. JEL0065]|nr:hypothetical protein HDU68_005716 [Siphonaria sp. JEL0065]